MSQILPEALFSDVSAKYTMDARSAFIPISNCSIEEAGIIDTNAGEGPLKNKRMLLFIQSVWREMRCRFA